MKHIQKFEGFLNRNKKSILETLKDEITDKIGKKIENLKIELSDKSITIERTNDNKIVRSLKISEWKDPMSTNIKNVDYYVTKAVNSVLDLFSKKRFDIIATYSTKSVDQTREMKEIKSNVIPEFVEKFMKTELPAEGFKVSETLDELCKGLKYK